MVMLEYLMRSPKHPKLSDKKLRVNIVRRYVEQEMSIRDVATYYGVSYGWVRKVLVKSGTVLRSAAKRSSSFDLETTLRRCWRCGDPKQLKYFVKDATKPGGRSYCCGSCDRLRWKTGELDPEE